MKAGLKKIFSILAILTFALSLYACSSIPMSSMSHMDMGDLADSAERHIEHANSLTSAIIPTFVLFVVACMFIVFSGNTPASDFSLVFLYSINKKSSPTWTKPRHLLTNPRSPPFS